MYWHLVADSKAVFFSNYDVGRREEPVLRMGTGGSEEQRKLRSQQVRGQLSWPSLTTASISRRPKSLLNPTINVLETAWRAACTGELHVGISWPWEEQVWCRQACRGWGVTACHSQKPSHQVLQLLYYGQEWKWVIFCQPEREALRTRPMGVDIVTSLPTVTRNREIGDSSGSWQLRRPSPGHGRLPRILGGQETHLLVSGNKRN